MTWLNATYRVRAPAHEIEAIALAIALEQSVEVPLAAVKDAYVREHIVARVQHITPLAEGEYEVSVALAEETMGDDPAQTLNMLFGNTSMHAHVELIDADLPLGLVKRCGGPRFGIEGLRAKLGVAARPMTCAALKPQGLSTEALAKLCERFARGGVDVIKDDHGLADQRYSPFAERVRACQGAIAAAHRSTGRSSFYAPNLIGPPRTLYEQAHIAREEGVGIVMVAPALVGLPVFEELVSEHLQGIAVLAHPAWAGAARVAPAFLMGKLFRLYGADAVIYPHYMGRFAYSQAQCRQIAETARRAWPGVRTAMPVPAGGMVVERVDELVRFYGRDVLLLIGGSLLLADDVEARTRQFVQVVEDADAALEAGG
ncbi:MAG TPA: RuBisCO large subunit C-terminal-like domain-containing protein [Burkholderiales bacterium]|nr:RuBisCO large subunit C-terminal-like domain-containing protein [Burkholderiales bacterium]